MTSLKVILCLLWGSNDTDSYQKIRYFLTWLSELFIVFYLTQPLRKHWSENAKLLSKAPKFKTYQEVILLAILFRKSTKNSGFFGKRFRAENERCRYFTEGAHKITLTSLQLCIWKIVIFWGFWSISADLIMTNRISREFWRWTFSFRFWNFASFAARTLSFTKVCLVKENSLVRECNRKKNEGDLSRFFSSLWVHWERKMTHGFHFSKLLQH